MVESRENTSNPVQRIFRNPTYIGIRMLLAGIAVGGIAGCGEHGANVFERKVYSSRIERCPENISEVSLVAGGNPQNWKAIEGTSNSWVFENQKGEILTGAYRGRVDTEELGPLPHGETRFNVKRGWYVCPEIPTSASSEKPISPPRADIPPAIPATTPR